MWIKEKWKVGSDYIRLIKIDNHSGGKTATGRVKRHKTHAERVFKIIHSNKRFVLQRESEEPSKPCDKLF